MRTQNITYFQFVFFFLENCKFFRCAHDSGISNIFIILQLSVILKIVLILRLLTRRTGIAFFYPHSFVILPYFSCVYAIILFHSRAIMMYQLTVRSVHRNKIDKRNETIENDEIVLISIVKMAVSTNDGSHFIWIFINLIAMHLKAMRAKTPNLIWFSIEILWINHFDQKIFI